MQRDRHWSRETGLGNATMAISMLAMLAEANEWRQSTLDVKNESESGAGKSVEVAVGLS